MNILYFLCHNLGRHLGRQPTFLRTSLALLIGLLAACKPTSTPSNDSAPSTPPAPSAAPAPDAPAESITWLRHRTEHFDFHYEKDSPAERDLTSLARLLEDYYRDLSQLHGVTFPAPIPYYFYSRPVEHAGKQLWGVAHFDESGSIRVLYSDQRKDSSPHELRHQFHYLANPRAPAFFNEGGCNLGVTLGDYDFYQLARAHSPDGFPRPLAAYIDGFAFHYSTEEALVAYSFCNFLADTYGASRWGQLYALLTPENYAEQLATWSGQPFAELERLWRARLQATPIPDTLKNQTFSK